MGCSLPSAFPIYRRQGGMSPREIGMPQGRLCASQRLPHYKYHTLILNNERDSKYFALLKDWINAGAKP